MMDFAAANAAATTHLSVVNEQVFKKNTLKNDFNFLCFLHLFLSESCPGNRQAGTGGTDAGQPQHQPFKKLYKNPLGLET